MLEAVALNANRRNGDLCLYEFGNCYFYDESETLQKKTALRWPTRVPAQLSPSAGVSTLQSWNAEARKASFFTCAVAEAPAPLRYRHLRPEDRSRSKATFSTRASLSLNGKELMPDRLRRRENPPYDRCPSKVYYRR